MVVKAPDDRLRCDAAYVLDGHDGLERLCQGTDEFSTHCSTQHSSFGSGVVRFAQDNHRGTPSRRSIRSASRRSRAAMANLGQSVARIPMAAVIGGDRSAVDPIPITHQIARSFSPRYRRRELILFGREVRGRVRLSDGDRLFFIQLYRWFPTILKAIYTQAPSRAPCCICSRDCRTYPPRGTRDSENIVERHRYVGDDDLAGSLDESLALT